MRVELYHVGILLFVFFMCSNVLISVLTSYVFGILKFSLYRCSILIAKKITLIIEKDDLMNVLVTQQYCVVCQNTYVISISVIVMGDPAIIEIPKEH